MNGVWKLAVVAFLFLLTGVAVASGQSRPGLGTSQVDQQQEKLCLTCHSPRFPPNDTSHDHWVYGYDPHAYGSPCTVCHGESGPTGGVVGMGWADQYNVGNEQHPTVDESAAMGKSELDCKTCHYPHRIQEELQAGSIIASTPPYEPTVTTWAFMVAAGLSLITSVCVVGVSLSGKKSRN